LAGGDTAPAVVPGDPSKSLLIEAVSYTNKDLQMPPKSRLTTAQVADLTTWISHGAAWPATPATSGSAGGTTSASGIPAFDLQKRKAAWWAWKPVAKVTPPPAVNAADASWAHGDIDRLVLTKLAEQQLHHAAPADRPALIRRLYLDLIGLPPSPAEVDAFVADTAADATATVVDRLLASPQFGVRWARHWLDLVRYAESRGHEFDYTLPNAYQYRDYVVRAFNLDLPYNRFLTEQIAGDLLPQPRTNPQDGYNESVIGTGFWELGENVHSPVDIRQDQADRFDNMIDVMGKTFLALTVACARCHDHKFDAISSKDYYALSGFIESSSYRQVRFETDLSNHAIAEQLWKLREQHLAPVMQEVAASYRPVLDHLDSYLLAAREVLLTPLAIAIRRMPLKVAGQLSPDEISRATSYASTHGLDPAILLAWVSHLVAAEGLSGDPFNGWAHFSLKFGAQASAIFIQPPALAATPTPLIDFAAPGSEDWLPDGVSFGEHTVHHGDIRLGNDPLRPINEVAEMGMSAFDPAWQCLKRANYTKAEPSSLNYDQAGRSFRTRTFEITGDHIQVLMRGSGHIYCGVAQHTMINAPLHRQLVRKIESTGAFQWQAMDVSAYHGLSTYLQFTAESPDFAVARISLTDNGASVSSAGGRALSSALAGAAPAGDPAALATIYGKILGQVMVALTEQRLGTANDHGDSAYLANWLVHHPLLFGAGRCPLPAAQAFVTAENALISTIHTQSHLAPAIMDGSGVDAYVMKRGSWRNRGDNAPRQFLEAIAGSRQPPIAAGTGSGRLELARRMTDPANPFAARVIVNRLWYHLFGRGIVPTVDNFGVLGSEPSNPALLDYLANDFIAQGWSMKHAIRTMVLSATYQMSSAAEPKDDARDPDNRYLHRMPIRRLEGEAIRDSILAVSGCIDLRLGGPSVPVFLTTFLEGRGRPNSGPLDGNGRRSIYLSVRRNFMSPMLMAFDEPTPFNTIGQRTVSNVPAQALILMNDPFVVGEAQRWAQKLLTPATPTTQSRIILMFRTLFSRPPRDDEMKTVTAFLAERAAALGLDASHQDDLTLWTDLAHALFNCKEFIFNT